MNAQPQRRAKQRQRPQQRRDSLLSQLLAAENGLEFLATIRAAGQRLDEIDAVTPPGTFVETAVDVVRKETDLPPEIAWGVIMLLMGAALAQNRCTVSWPHDHRPQELSQWLVILAPSGAGKTLLRNAVAESLGLELTELPEPGSARAFLDSLCACEGRALWVRDEYGQLMQQIKTGGPLGPLRDYLLRAYDHSALEVTTKKDGTARVDRVVLSVLGGSVDSSWASCVDAQMLVDGLLARHLFICAKRRPMRVPIYPMQHIRAMLEASAQAQGLRERLALQDQHFVITPAAADVYRELWCELVGALGDRIDPAYVRRVTWAAGRYSVLYHLLLGRDGLEIGTQALRWAWRAVLLHLQYARTALALSDAGFSQRLDKIMAWAEARIAQGADPASAQFVRDMLQHFRRDLGNAQEARQFIDLVAKTGQKR
jgi:hypothetical protein